MPRVCSFRYLEIKHSGKNRNSEFRFRIDLGFKRYNLSICIAELKIRNRTSEIRNQKNIFGTMATKQIALMAGGFSGEYNVSLNSAKNIKANLDPAKYTVYT